jgi:hypothetical protein
MIIIKINSILLYKLMKHCLNFTNIVTLRVMYQYEIQVNEY